jgi:hypothetical protein
MRMPGSEGLIDDRDGLDACLERLGGLCDRHVRIAINDTRSDL